MKAKTCKTASFAGAETIDKAKTWKELPLKIVTKGRDRIDKDANAHAVTRSLIGPPS